MAAPAYESFNEGKAADTSVVVTKPTGTAEDDLLIGCLSSDGGGETHTSPESDSWSDIYVEQSEGSGTQTFSMWWKIAGDSEPANYTFGCGSSEGLYAWVIRISGAHQADPIHKKGVVTGDSQYPNPSTVTTEVDDCLIIHSYGCDHIDVDVDANWIGTDIVNITQDFYNASGGAGGGSAHAPRASAGQTNAGYATLTAIEEWAAIIIAIQPPAAAVQELTASPVAVTSSIQASTIAGSGNAPLTASPVAVTSSIQNSALTATGTAPLTASPIAVASSVQAAAVITSIQYLVASPVAVASSVQQASIAGTGTAPLTGAAVSVASSIQTAAIAGSGNAPLTASPVAVTSSIQVATIAGSGTANLAASSVSVASSVVKAEVGFILKASPVAVASSVVAASISGVGIAGLTAATIAVTTSIQNAALAGAGAAPLISAPVQVTSSIVAAALAGSGIAPLTGAAVAVVTSIMRASIDTTVLATLYNALLARHIYEL